MGNRIIACRRHRPGVIKGSDYACQPGGYGLTAAIPLPLLHHLITDAPYKDRRMVTVTKHHRFNILPVPFIKIKTVIEFSLLHFPDIKRLIHNDESHPVTQVKQLRCRGIMGGADAVASHLLQ